MSFKQKIMTALVGVMVTLAPASAFASTYNGTTVSPLPDGVTYPISASSGDSLTLANAGQGGNQLTITFKNNVNGTIVIKPSTTLPSSASNAPTGNVSAYYDVSLNGLSNNDISSSTWNFSATKSFLSNLGLSTSNIFLAHFNGSGWDRLSTKLVGSDATNNNFSAAVTSFSPFAVVAVPGLSNTGTSYAVLAAGGLVALALVAGAYVVTRKRTRQHAA
jgi:PGF-pre-PGF domain-containing protein